MPVSSTVICAPIAVSAEMWKSSGRGPIWSPPTSGTKASPVRFSSGPSSSTGIRLRPVKVCGTAGASSLPRSTIRVSASRSTVAPRERSIEAVISTSPTRGAFEIRLGPSPSRAATMCLVTAFFEPRTVTSPRSGPVGSIFQALVMGAIVAQITRLGAA
jgi:hypothetical protein